MPHVMSATYIAGFYCDLEQPAGRCEFLKLLIEESVGKGFGEMEARMLLVYLNREYPMTVKSLTQQQQLKKVGSMSHKLSLAMSAQKSKLLNIHRCVKTSQPCVRAAADEPTPRTSRLASVLCHGVCLLRG